MATKLTFRDVTRDQLSAVANKVMAGEALNARDREIIEFAIEAAIEFDINFVHHSFEPTRVTRKRLV